MKDDAEGVAMSGTQAADAVPHVDAIEATRALDGAMMNREGHSVSLTKRNDFGSRLHARTLLGQHEFSASEVFAWL
jgi:hypothetical protein